MQLNKETIQEIKQRIAAEQPNAEVILYGSFARGDAGPDSDIDLLILINKPEIKYAETARLTGSLYRYGIQTGRLVSPLVRTKKDWEEKFYFTPFYHNVKKEGIAL